MRVSCACQVGIESLDALHEYWPAATAREIPAQLALLALGLLGPEHGRLLADLGVQLGRCGDDVARDEN